MADKLVLDIVTPHRSVLSEEVDIVVAPGALGEFGVLIHHIPFLAQLKIGELRYRQGNSLTKVAVMGGYAEVLPDKVTVLAPAAEKAVEIDVVRAKAAKERAERRLQEKKEDIDFARAHAALIRAILRLKLVEVK